mgnify:FL=1
MSTLKADTIQSTSGGAATLTKQHAAKAWATIDETGSSSLRDSFNVSGITDNGTGDFSHAFSSSFANVNHASSCNSNATLGNNHNRGTNFAHALSASSIRHMSCTQDNGSLEDQEAMMVISFGDLA